MIIIYANIFCKYYRIIHMWDIIIIISFEPKNTRKKEKHIWLYYLFSLVLKSEKSVPFKKQNFKPYFPLPQLPVVDVAFLLYYNFIELETLLSDCAPNLRT